MPYTPTFSPASRFSPPVRIEPAAEQTVPYELPANATQSGTKSRSSKGGTPANFNEIRMEDKKGAEHIQQRLGNGQVIALVAQIVVAAVQCQVALVDAIHTHVLACDAVQPTRYGNYIGGEFVPPVKGQYFTNTSPVNGQPIAEFPRSTAEDIDKALDKAVSANDIRDEKSIVDALMDAKAKSLKAIEDRPANLYTASDFPQKSEPH